MPRTLQPGNRIARYVIVGPLGAGGMGEVYRARDESLGRDVAIKILPPELVTSPDRVRRFILEAKSASSLNHPHIVTIYEVGQAPVTGADGAADAGAGAEPVHFIAMELVSGRTLKALIHAEKTDLRALLGFLAQAAEGLSKAHAAGIVHRDLKPSNIMVTTDGYAKILDFGLAKLTEREAPAGEVTSAPTTAGDRTGAAILGTAEYMSPEQVRGRSVDHRADIFSFGCILYEAAARRPPFSAPSPVETMHKILHDQPAPLDDPAAGVPAELRRLIRRCMAKSPEQRLQSSKDLALELREIVDEFEALSISSASAISGSGAALPAARRRPAASLALAVVAVLGLAGIAFGLYSWLVPGGGTGATGRRFESIRMSSLLSLPGMESVTLSKDGRYLAYVSAASGRFSLRVRQVATGSDVEVLPAGLAPIHGVSFSPGGDHIYYLGRDPETPSYSALFEIPSLGGTPRKRIFDVDSPLTFSPDGRRGAFVRGVPQDKRADLVVMTMDSGEERVLTSVQFPERLQQASVAWSPDGARIAGLILTSSSGVSTRLVTFDAEDGRREDLGGDRFLAVDSLSWLPDGRGMIVAGNHPSTINPQLYLVEYPGGAARPITRDLDTYESASVSKSDGTLVALRTSRPSRLWTAPLEAAPAERPITAGAGSWLNQPQPAADGSIVFVTEVDRFAQIASIRPDGTGQRFLTSGKGHAIGVRLAPGEDTVVFTLYSIPDMVGHVHRVDLDGGNLARLTSGEGEVLLRVTSGDEPLTLFRRGDQDGSLWSVPLRGGEPKKLFDDIQGWVVPSPDGSLLAHLSSKEIEGRQVNLVRVTPLAGGDPVLEFRPAPEVPPVVWSPDGKALFYLRRDDGVDNLWRQPLSGGEPSRVTSFPEGIFGWTTSFSPDGRRLAVSRKIGDAAWNVWVMNADGSGATPVTAFKTGFVQEPRWAADGKSIVFVQGEERREAVLIREAEAGS